MIKSSIIALVTVAAMGSVAAPAFAYTDNGATSGTGAFGEGSSQQREFAADNILSRLQQLGVQATSVEEWGGLIRAYVTMPDGSQAMQFFAEDSLKPVSL